MLIYYCYKLVAWYFFLFVVSLHFILRALIYFLFFLPIIDVIENLGD